MCYVFAPHQVVPVSQLGNPASILLPAYTRDFGTPAQLGNTDAILLLRGASLNVLLRTTN